MSQAKEGSACRNSLENSSGSSWCAAFLLIAVKLQKVYTVRVGCQDPGPLTLCPPALHPHHVSATFPDHVLGNI